MISHLSPTCLPVSSGCSQCSGRMISHLSPTCLDLAPSKLTCLPLVSHGLSPGLAGCWADKFLMRTRSLLCCISGVSSLKAALAASKYTIFTYFHHKRCIARFAV